MRQQRSVWSALLLIIVLVVTLFPNTPRVLAAGFSITITTTADEWSTDTATMAQSKCSLREALQATVSNNPVGNQGCGPQSVGNFSEYTFVMPGGTYLLTLKEQLPYVSKKITINGNNAVTIDGGSKSNRVDGIFTIGASEGELILQKLKLQYGWRPFGGAIWIKAGTVRLTEVELYRNLADNGSGNGDGGAIAVDTGELICVKSTFTENTARQSGGAISSGGVSVLLDRCEFMRNHAELNGGAYAGFSGSETTHPIMRDSKFHDNWIYQTTVPATWPSQYQFTDDQSGGGAIYNKGYMELERTQIWNNYTKRSKGGGAIYNQGELRFLDVAISKNEAKTDDPVPFTLGGAILNDGLLIARRTSIHANKASFGGAIMNRLSGKLYLVSSTIANNQAKTGGGLSNGYNFLMNGAPKIDQGGEANIYHSTLVRAKDDNGEPANIVNLGNGYVYMANSVMDSECSGVINTYGGNIFKKRCERVSANSSIDKTNTDILLENIADLGLEGLSNNGGANLPEAQFLSAKVGSSGPAVDIAQAEYCTDPALQPLFLINKDQIMGTRPNGPACDAGAIEVGSSPPVWESDPSDEQGLVFPLSVVNNKPSTTTDLILQNTGGGVIAWSWKFQSNPGGIFSAENAPTSGSLGKNQKTTLTFRCTPTNLGWTDGLLVVETNVPGKEKLKYIMSCALREDPTKAFASRQPPPGPVSGGSARPGGQNATDVQIGNRGVDPMGATMNMQDPALADTIQFSVGGPAGASQVSLETLSNGSPQASVTIPGGSTITVTITCKPPAPGLFVNTLRITTTDTINPHLDYPISCEGAPLPEPEPLSPVSLSQQSPKLNIMGMALSPDGKQLLAGHWSDNQIEVYSIPNTNSGALVFKNRFSVTGMSTITGIRYSHDGHQVYYSSFGGNGVVAADRAANGDLSFLQSITTDTNRICGVNPIKFCAINTMGGARALDISPDDLNVYVTGVNDDTLTVLRRNPADGKLTFTQKITATIEGTAIMTGPFGVLVSPDGANVYVGSRDSDTVIAFSRNSENGKLRYLTHVKDGQGAATGLNGPTQLLLSPDGKFLYVASVTDDAVQIFARNPADGFITPLEEVKVGDGPYHIDISHDPDGTRLLVALWPGDEVKSYTRDPQTGKITPLSGQAALTMNGPVYLVSTGDDRHVYAGLYDGQGVQFLQSTRHKPILQNISPASVIFGSDDVTLTINGTRFYSDSVVLWNGAALTTKIINAHKLEAVVPASKLTAVTIGHVTVRTSPPGGGTSEPLDFMVTTANGAPVPSVKSLNPSSISNTGEPLNVTVSGAGFLPESQAKLNGWDVKTTYVNSTTLLVELTEFDTYNTGPLALEISNENAPAAPASLQADASTQSVPVKFEVVESNAPALPSISGLKPQSYPVGSSEQWLTVQGYNFSLAQGASSVGYWNGSARETVVLDEHTLQMRLTTDDLKSAGKTPITVFTPGTGESDPQSLTVLAAGVNPIAEVEVASMEVGYPRHLVISGDNFVNGAQVLLNGKARPTTFVSQFVLIATVSYEDVQNGGLVRVANPNTAQSAELVMTPRLLVFMPIVTLRKTP